MAIRHTEETRRERILRQKMSEYVDNPTGQAAMFAAWRWFGFGLLLSFAVFALITDSPYFLAVSVIAFPAIGYGAWGQRMLNRRLDEFYDDILTATADRVVKRTVTEPDDTAVPGERNIPIRRGGRNAEPVSIADENLLSSEAWRSVAIALLVNQAKFSRRGICGLTAERGWQWGKISQGQYSQFVAYMFKNKYAKEGQYGTELLAGGWDLLQRYVPSHMSLELERPASPAA